MEIDFSPTPKQWLMFETFDDQDTTEVLFGGGVGSAKSYGLCSLITIKCLEYAGARVLLGRRVLKDLKKTTLVSLFEVFADFGLTTKDYNYNQQSSEVTFLNGSVILLAELAYLPSDPSYERLRGNLLTFAAIDEASEVSAKAREIVASRCGRWKNEEFNVKPMLFMTTNPSRGHLMDDFYLPFTKGTLKNHRKFIQALPQDNPYLPKAYIDNLKNTLSNAEYRTLVLGFWEWSANDNCLVTYDGVINMFDYNEPDALKEDYYLSVDVAFSSDKCVLILWNGDDVLEVIDLPKNVKPEDKIKELKDKYGIFEKNIVIDVVGAGLYLKNYFPRAYQFNAGGKVLNAEPYEHLKTQTYAKLADKINKGEIRIHTKNHREDIITECMQIITLPAELIGGKMKMITKKDIKHNIGHSPDFLDALSMRCVYYIKRKYKQAF